MSVKHLEYLKINGSKVLVVEVRPVKCLLDSPSGPTHTDKWMEHSHWKELYHLMTDIVDEYEEQKTTQAVKCNQPKCKTGATIQVGYMFRGLPSCFCSLYFLSPRNNCTWTEDDADGELQDKGGRFDDFALCGEMLVISVILRDSSPSSTTETTPTPSCSSTFQQACLNQKLIKALDNGATYVSSISDYFKASAPSTDDSPASCVPSSSSSRERSPSQRVKTSTSCNAEQENKGDKSMKAVKMTDSSDGDSSLYTSRSLLLKEKIHKTVEREMDVLLGYNSDRAIITDIKLNYDCVECTRKVFTVTSCDSKNLESIKRLTQSACQCSAVSSNEVYNNSASSTSESEDMFTNLEFPAYQHDTMNDSNVSCSRSENLCSPVRDNTQWKSDNLQSQTDSSSTSDTNHEADENSKLQSVVDDSSLIDIVKEECIGVGEEYCVSQEMDIWSPWMIPIQSWEVVQTSESSVNGNECEGQEDTLPHMIHNNYLPGENTSEKENDWRHSTRPVEELASTSEDQVMDAVNSMSEDLPVSLKFEYYVPEKLVQVEASQGSTLSASPMHKFHAANEAEEVLHFWSDSTEKGVGYNVPSTRTATQECLPAGRLLTPMTDVVLSAPDTSKNGSACDSSVSPQTCESVNFVVPDVQQLQQSPQPECQGTKISIKSILKNAHSSTKSDISNKSMKVTYQQTSGKEQYEKIDSSEKKCKAQVQNVNVKKKRKVHPSSTKASKGSLPKEEDRWLGMSCSSTSAVAGESSAREDLPNVKEGLYSQLEGHCLNGKLLHDRADPSTSSQNSCAATADEVDKQGSATNFLANQSEQYPNKKETSAFHGYEKPEKELELQDNGACRADEEYIPSKVTCKWKKTKRKRNVPHPELEYVPTSIRDTTEDSVLQEGDGAHDVEASVKESHGSANKCETKLEYHGASCRADLEYVPEKVTCKWKKRKNKNVPNPELEIDIKNVTHFPAECNYPCSEEDSVVASDLPHGTQVSVGLPLCVESKDCVSERKKLQIQAGTCDSLSLCKKEYAGNTGMEDLDPLSASTEQYDSQEIADTLETQQECVPTQRLVSHGNGETCNKIDHLQNSQNCTQSFEFNKEPLEESILLHHQQAAQKETEEGVPITQLLRSIRTSSSNSKDEDKQKKEKIAFRSKKNYYQTGRTEKINTYVDQKMEGKKKITSHISALDTPVKSNFSCSENIIGESLLEDDKLNSSDYKHRKTQVSVGMKKPKMKVTDDDATDEDCVFRGITPPKRKKKSVLSNEEDHVISRKEEPTKNCDSQTAGADQSGQDIIGASSNDCPPIKMSESTRLPEKNAPESLCPRRSTRLKGKIPGFAWLFNMCDDSDFEQFRNKHDIAKETEKSLKFFEKYVKQRNANASKSNLQQKKILDYVRRSSLSEQENQCKDWLFKSPDKKKSPVNVNKKVARSVKQKFSKTKTAEATHSVRNASPELPRPTVSKQDASERPYLNMEKAASKCHKVLDHVSGQENQCKDLLFKSPDRKKCLVTLNKKGARPVKKKCSKTKTAETPQSVHNTSPELPRPTVSKQDASERPHLNVKKAASKCHKETCDFTSDEQRKKTTKNNKCIRKRKKSVSQKRKNVSSPEKVIKNKLKKKTTITSDTSTADDLERDIENCASASKKGARYWTRLDEMEEQDSVVMDTPSNQDSFSSLRPEEESSEPREKVVKKRGRKKVTISDTSTVDGSERDIENCASKSEMDSLLWIKEAEMQEQDSELSDDNTNQDSCSSPRPEEELSESMAKEEQPQHTEREDDLDIIYYRDMDSLKASYKRLQSMTKSDLEQRLNENLYYLEQVIRGQVPNERHEMFVSSLQRLKQQQDYLICGPFTTDQTEYVLELLKKKLKHLEDNLFVNLYDALTYRCRVLMPTFLTKIVMDNENISLRMAEDLLVKFSLDQKITGATSSRDWRKF